VLTSSGVSQSFCFLVAFRAFGVDFFGRVAVLLEVVANFFVGGFLPGVIRSFIGTERMSWWVGDSAFASGVVRIRASCVRCREG
jgi:hypothetical protein